MGNFIYLLIFFVSLLYPSAKPIAPQKYAVIIAIANYPKESGWPQLHSNRDVNKMCEALIGQNFKKENILIIQESQATKLGIQALFNDLINKNNGKLNGGDQVVVLFSGHGQQIYDDNGDELDSLDETIVPFDAPMKISYTKYKGEKHIRDDEFGIWMDSIRLKVGPRGQLLVIIDSCYSSTTTRGPIPSRGGPPILPDGWARNSSIKNNDEQSGLKEASFSLKASDLRSPMIILSGSAANQKNFEIIDDEQEIMGALTYAVCKAFNSPREKGSYRAFFAEISETMISTSPNQTPGLEGDADYKVFNGGLVSQQAYFKINKIINDSVYLNSGSFMGASIGSDIEFHPAGTPIPNNTSFLAKGKVVSSSPLYSKVKLENGRLVKGQESAWGFITRRSYNSWQVPVAIDNALSVNFRNRLFDSLSKHPIIKIVEKQNSHVVFADSEANPNSVLLSYTSDSSIIGEPIKGIDQNDVIKNAISSLNNFVIGKFLKEVCFSDCSTKLPSYKENPDYKVSVTLYSEDPAVNNKKVNVTKGNVPYLIAGKPAWVVIKNEGTKDIYYNVLDFQPDGVVNVILPKHGVYEPNELFLKKGATSKPYKIKVSPPFGMEMYRVFVSNQPFDLRLSFGSFQTKGTYSWWNEKILNGLNFQQKTKGGDSSFDPNAAGVGSYTFEIVPNPK